MNVLIFVTLRLACRTLPMPKSLCGYFHLHTVNTCPQPGGGQFAGPPAPPLSAIRQTRATKYGNEAVV
jgi:hypothetical protein